MSFTLDFTPAAQNDILEAINWYNTQKEDLGLEFYQTTEEKLNQIIKAPLHYSVYFKNVRTRKLITIHI
jgi:hypothetical protein